MPTFPIMTVRPEELAGDEALGSKTKFWFRQRGSRWLFKEVREGTGEDWAEKIAAEVATLIGIDAATVELAEFEGRRGCASLSFVNTDAGDGLVHGNEILGGTVLGYDRGKTFHQSDHTLTNIHAAFESLFPDQTLRDSALATLSGYTVLDALTGNTDRHHENWAFLMRDGVLSVAPSFDHASSLGRELTDDRRRRYLDLGQVSRYVANGHGAIFLNSVDPSGANPLDLVKKAASQQPDYYSPALERLSRVDPDEFTEIVARVPETRMTPIGQEFAVAFMFYTWEALCRLPR